MPKKQKEKNKKADSAAGEPQDVTQTPEAGIINEGEVTEEVGSKGTDSMDELTVAKADYQDLNDKYLRLYSDFDNYRKRTMRERAELLKTASSGLITQLLPVLDDFDRANRSFESSDDLSALKQGVDLIYVKFRKILEQKGLEEIKAVGEVFDTDLHEAITNFPAESEEMKGHVVEEIEKGYTLNGTVVRFARVAVAN